MMKPDSTLCVHGWGAVPTKPLLGLFAEGHFTQAGRQILHFQTLCLSTTAMDSVGSVQIVSQK
jgi:hypothetical protein